MNNECWLEMDLYWFQGAPPAQRVRELFDRLTPLWNRAPGARKGLTLCVAWLPDSVLLWNDKPGDVIACCGRPTYDTWTYQRLADLIALIRTEAAARNLGDFHVGLMLFGGGGSQGPQPVRKRTEGYGGRTEELKEQPKYHHVGRWLHEHPEVRDPRFIPPYYFNATVLVPADEAVCHTPQPSLAEYFASKFASLCRFTGLNALVLRDNILSPEYRRGFGLSRYMDPAASSEWNRGCQALARCLKKERPGLVLIGYSSGTSGMEEWRSNGFDLEGFARTGCVDLWITQTWASAWQDYWPCHSMGYTFQLSTLLVQAAMIADTPCKHLFLVETFDAWEPWDSIRQYPSKVAWEIWAYSHASVRLPGGQVKRAAGFYSSWMNRGPELLPPESVDYLAGVFSSCAADLALNPVPGGPCLVYHRHGLETLLAAPADYCRGEAMDDWTAMLQKYGFPVLSITRSEWLKDVEADALVFPAPAAIGEPLAATLLERLRRGVPVLFMGQASLLSAPLRKALDIAVRPEPVLNSQPGPAVIEDPALAALTGTRGLVLNQRQSSLIENKSWKTLIRFGDSPVLARHAALPCLIWETPEWGTPTELQLLHQSILSPQTYVAAARAAGENGWGPERLRWTNRDWQKPVCFLFWRYETGGLGVLLGNIETGLTGNSQFYVHGSLSYAGKTPAVTTTAGTEPVVLAAGEEQCAAGLGPYKSCVLSLNFPPA